MFQRGVSCKGEYGFQNRRARIIFMGIACLLLLYSHIFSSSESIIAFAIIVFSLVFGIETSLCVYLCAFIIQIQFTDFQVRLLMIFMTGILLYSIVQNKVYKQLQSYFALFLIFWICTLFSTLVGYKTQIISCVPFLFQLLLTIGLAYYSQKDADFILYALVMSGLCVCLFVFYQYITGNAAYFGMSLVYGDGEEAGQVKDLSVCAAIPAYYCSYCFIYKSGKLRNKLFLSTLFVICIAVIVLTYSRGVLISLALSLLYLVLSYSKNKFSFKKLLLFIVACVVVGYVLSLLEFDEDKMLRNLEGGNGRVEIWSYYFSKLKEGGLSRLLFGFGSGDSRRITEGSMYSGVYAHSVILDYFFSYGIIGLVFIVSLLGHIARRLFLGNNVIYLGLLFLISLMFFTHGSSTNILFHSVLGVCLGTGYLNKRYYSFFPKKADKDEQNNSR